MYYVCVTPLDFIGSNDCHAECLKCTVLQLILKKNCTLLQCVILVWLGVSHVHLKCLHYKVMVAVTPT